MSGGLAPGIPASNGNKDQPRFPRLEDCAHFHYEYTEIGPISVEVLSEEDEVKPLICYNDNGSPSNSGRDMFSVQVTSLAKTWIVKRSYENFIFLDKQVHQCVFDRKISMLPELPLEENLNVTKKESVRHLLSTYLERFSSLAGPVITCGPVLNWLELDNRGHRLIISEDGAINRPAVAAAYAVKRYAKQAPDEISFEVGDMISVIDMPPPDESIWWRGKRGFEVGFFPCECVEVIGDKLPQGLNLPTATTTGTTTTTTTTATGRKVTSSMSINHQHHQHHHHHGSSENEDEDEADSDSPSSEPTKPVLRKHGKLISFFRSFILSRPTRGKLKKSGILKERVFGCDLSEHLLNTGQDVPRVLTHCAEFIETAGMIDGIYRLSGIASNIQKLRVAFDEDRVPNLYQDKGVIQDVHSVSSLLKMYFRELPNPLCTYYLYDKFVEAARSPENERLILMRDVVQQLPPPNYRTLEYLSRHLYRVSLRGHETGMTAKNVAIVWAPNLLRSKSLEGGGVAALQGVGVQAVVTECLIRYCELIFNDKMPTYNNGRASTSPPPAPPMAMEPKKSRPKSLAISTPTKLLSLEEARNRALAQAAANLGNMAGNNSNNGPSSAVGEPQRYIEVGGGPENLPAKYHTVIDFPSRKGGAGGSMKARKSPIGWKAIFTGGKSSKPPKPIPKISSPAAIDLSTVANNSKLMLGGDLRGTWNRQILRPVKSAESLIMLQRRENSLEAESQPEDAKEAGNSSSRPISGDSDDIAPLEMVTQGMGNMSRRRGTSQKGHERSNSHDSYFERQLQFGKNDDKHSDSGVKMDSSLDLSEIQVNFELEENEMRIFTEDMISNSLGSDLSKSPLEEKQQQQQQQLYTTAATTSEATTKIAKKSPKISSSENEGGDESPKSRTKMSFREKFKRFTSPTPTRMRGDSEEGQLSEPETPSIIRSEQVKRTSTSIRDKLVCALSPESLRRRHNVENVPVDSHVAAVGGAGVGVGDVSPKKKKSSFSPGTSPSANLVKRSKIEDDAVVVVVEQATNNTLTMATASPGLPISPSIKFIDSSMHESTDSTMAKLLTTGENDPTKAETVNPRFSTTSSTDEDGGGHVVLDQLVVAQVHHDPILESHHEHEADDEDSDDLVAQQLFDDTDKRSAMSVDMMTSFKQDFAQKFSLNNSQQQQQQQQQSGDKTPSDLSVSIAGATVSENESFSILSVEEDQFMIPVNNFNENCEVATFETSESRNLLSQQMLPHQSVIQCVDDEATTEKDDFKNEKPEFFAQTLHTISSLKNEEEEVEAMEVDESKLIAGTKLHYDDDVEQMDVDETSKPAAVKNRFDYRPLLAKETSTSSTTSSSRSSVSEESETGKIKSESSETSSTSSDHSNDKWQVDKSDEKPLIDDEKSEAKHHVVSTVLYAKQTSRFTMQLSGDAPVEQINQVEKPSQNLQGCQKPEAQKSSKDEMPKSSAAKTDFTIRTFGPQPYTRKENLGPSHPVLQIDPHPIASQPQGPVVQFEMESDDCIVDLRRSYGGGFRTGSGRFSQPAANESSQNNKLESSREEREEAMDDYDEGEAKSFSLPFIHTEVTEIDGRRSAQGIPEVEKKLSFAEPNLTKVPSDGVISKGKKLSTFSLHSAGENDITGIGAIEELPLQRRNSIHNVPYVDVNDPATRERMERYKEERRSMLRAKYRVEDYREKPPVSPTSKATSPTSSTPNSEMLVTSPGGKKSTNEVEKTSPSLSRFRKSSTSSVDKTTSVDKMSIDKSPKVERGTTSVSKNNIVESKVVETAPTPALRKLPIEKPIAVVGKAAEQPSESTPVTRKWSSNSRTSLNSFDNKKVSVSIIEPEVTLRKVTATPTSDVIIPPILQKAVPTTVVTPTRHDNDVTKHIFPTSGGKGVTAPRSKLTSRSSCPTGLVEEDVNVRERAALFNTAAAHRANQAELRTKFVSLIPPSCEENKNSGRKNNSGSVGKLGGPGSPSKIKNIAALFEQKT